MKQQRVIAIYKAQCAVPLHQTGRTAYVIFASGKHSAEQPADYNYHYEADKENKFMSE